MGEWARYAGPFSFVRARPMIEEDPRPTPPERPAPEMCCGRGCIPCIYDDYEEALARYEVALREWELRHIAQRSGPLR
jgi:Oxidoreductase-like protein, N-terminal